MISEYYWTHKCECRINQYFDNTFNGQGHLMLRTYHKPLLHGLISKVLFLYYFQINIFLILNIDFDVKHWFHFYQMCELRLNTERFSIYFTCTNETRHMYTIFYYETLQCSYKLSTKCRFKYYMCFRYKHWSLAANSTEWLIFTLINNQYRKLFHIIQMVSDYKFRYFNFIINISIYNNF